MSFSDSSIAWFDQQIETLPLTPTWTVPDVVVIDNTWAITESATSSRDPPANPSFQTILEGPPVGISHYKLRYRQIPLKRSGMRGWTYFPANAQGDRLARISYWCKIPNVYVTAIVKLTDYKNDDETDTWSVYEYALVKVDNLTAHGSLEMRSQPASKRRKLIIHH